MYKMKKLEINLETQQSFFLLMKEKITWISFLMRLKPFYLSYLPKLLISRKW